LVLFVSISISVIVYLIFTPERITPVVMKYANEYMNAHLECGSVELTFYSTFPNFGVRLRNGSIINIADSVSGCPQDTLLTFRDCAVSFNPIALYRKNQLIVNRIRLERPVVYAYVGADGKTNWDILPQSDSTDSSTINLPDITVHRISIADAGVIYDDRRQAIFVATDSLQLRAKGTLTDVALSLKIQAMTVLYDDKSYASKIPFAFDGRLLSDKSYQKFDIEKSTFSIGIIDFDVEGVVERDTVDSRTKIDVDFNLHSSDLMSVIPEHILNIKEKYTLGGIFDFAGRINGYLDAGGAYPTVMVDMHLKDGTIIDNSSPGQPLLQKMEMDCSAEIDPTNNVPSYVNINNIYLQNAAAKLNISGILDNIFTQPFVDIQVSSDIDFERFMQYMPVDTGIIAKGTVKADVAGNFFVDDLLAYNLGKINLAGNIDIDNVKFSLPDEGIELFAPMAKIRMGSNVADSIYGRVIASLLSANIELDSLTFKRKDELSLEAGRLFTTLHTTAPPDSTSIAKMAIYSRLSNLHLRTSDSIRLRATKISALGKLSPFAANPEMPEWTVRISMDSVRGIMPDFAGKIDSMVTEVKLHPRETRRQITAAPARRTPEDSIRRKTLIDSIVIANRNTAVVDFKLHDGEAKNILSNWEVTGSFAGKSFGMRTPYFPLRTALNESFMTFADDKLSIKRTRLQTEGSFMTLNGEIEGIRRALLYNGRVKANISIDVDSMDCNKIIRALAAGSAYSTKNVEQRDSISSAVLNETNEPADSVAGLFVVPRNIDMELNASMRNVRYNNFDIRRADGKIIVRNRAVKAPGLKIKSDIGNVDLSMVYKAPTTKGASAGLDIHMEQVQIKELIRSLPILDSLAPMMRSFEGMAECNIIAVAELDSLSNLVIPQTTALCHINGKNLVLLDGETFSSIAKKLYFKNKNRNVIDSISMDMMLDDNTISVLPFILSVDRYMAAVGGIQNLDMSFEYHISILKWPLPLIKPGLNLWGTPNDIHYRIASRKYEDMLTPVAEKSLALTVINIRQQLHDGLRKSIDAILSEDPDARFGQKSPVQLNDTIQSMLELDTIQ
jgi:hypothetical protein